MYSFHTVYKLSVALQAVSYIPVLHFAPLHPGIHRHRSGLMQVPPLAQPGWPGWPVQIALK